MTDASPTGFQSYTVTVDDGFGMVQDDVVVVNSQPFDLQNNCSLYSTLLLDPAATTTQGWAEGESYTVTIDFTDAGSAVTVVRDSDLVEIASFLVADTTYTTGFFGSTTASQEGACVGPLFAECL